MPIFGKFFLQLIFFKFLKLNLAYGGFTLRAAILYLGFDHAGLANHMAIRAQDWFFASVVGIFGAKFTLKLRK